MSHDIRVTVRSLLFSVLVLLILGFVAVSGKATADPTCGDGNWYDSTHRVCQPYPPAYPQPGYPQVCSGGDWYNPTHQVCQPYPPAYPPPWYP